MPLHLENVTFKQDYLLIGLRLHFKKKFYNIKLFSLIAIVLTITEKQKKYLITYSYSHLYKKNHITYIYLKNIQNKKYIDINPMIFRHHQLILLIKNLLQFIKLLRK
jgi:hypothetical protein